MCSYVTWEVRSSPFWGMSTYCGFIVATPLRFPFGCSVSDLIVTLKTITCKDNNNFCSHECFKKEVEL